MSDGNRAGEVLFLSRQDVEQLLEAREVLERCHDTFRWVGSGFLRFYWLPDSADADTVMVIYDPLGQWHCLDDSFSPRHPTIDFNPSQDGYYQIWVGTYSPGQNPPGTLYITEMDTNHP